MHRHSSSCSLKISGFTLTEIAIVLSVAGAIIGAIWATVATVSNNNKAYLAIQQVQQIAQNIREYYMNASGIFPLPPQTSACGMINQTLINANLIPPEMQTCFGPCTSGFRYIVHPFHQGEVMVGGSYCDPSHKIASRFYISLLDLSPSVCVQLLTSGLPYQDSSMGITAICGGTFEGAYCDPYAAGTGGSSESPGGTTASPGWLQVTCPNGICSTIGAGGAPVPMTQAQAKIYCTPGVNGILTVAWEFSLRGTTNP